MKITRRQLKELILETMGDEYEYEQAIRPAIMRALANLGVVEKNISREQHTWKGQNWGRGWQILFTTPVGVAYVLEFVDFEIYLYERTDEYDELLYVFKIPNIPDSEIENWFYQELTRPGVLQL